MHNHVRLGADVRLYLSVFLAVGKGFEAHMANSVPLMAYQHFEEDAA